MPHATPKQKSSLHLHDHLTDEPVPWAPFHSRRSVVYSASDNSGNLSPVLRADPLPAIGAKGLVACSQPLAAEAGLEILRKGGNAADAGKSARFPLVQASGLRVSSSLKD